MVQLESRGIKPAVVTGFGKDPPSLPTTGKRVERKTAALRLAARPVKMFVMKLLLVERW